MTPLEYVRADADADADAEAEAVDWSRTCWFGRFYGKACGRPADWSGPRESPNAVDRQWRACGEHHLPTDERL